MSNTSKGKATKGSKLMMQMVASPLQRIIIENKLGEQLCWLSPVEESDYEEYQLSDKVACDFMALEVNKNTFSFWPTRQPQWDGIAIGKETGTLYLFEAKSHLTETKTNCSASSSESREKIFSAIEKVAKETYGVDSKEIIENHWMNNNYQIANRLTFLEKMKQLADLSKNYELVKLVFLNFVNDTTWDINERVKDDNEWNEHYNNLFRDMHLCLDTMHERGVLIINYSAPYVY